MFVRSFSRADSNLPALDLLQLGFFSSPRMHMCSGSPFPVSGRVQMALSLLAPDRVLTGSAMSTRQLARSGPSALASDSVETDPSMSIRSSARLGPALLAPDFLHLGFPSPVRSAGRAGPALLILDFLSPGLSLPVQSSATAGFALLLGSCRAKLCSFLTDAGVERENPPLVADLTRIDSYCRWIESD